MKVDHLFGAWQKNLYCLEVSLKVVSAIYLLVCFLSVKEITYETRKNVFYFTTRALSVLEEVKV